MKTILDTAHTWFFERAFHAYLDELTLDLVEGVKSQERELVEAPDRQLGPYFPVRVLPESRCVTVRFAKVLAYQAVNESYGAPRTDIACDEGRLRECSALEYLSYLRKDTLIDDLMRDRYRAFMLWTEDQVFFVVAADAVVELSSRTPNLTIMRYGSYSAA